MDLIDLRSDTVTPICWDAIRHGPAEVGDDQFGEDPTINLLQERVANLLGKEAALCVPTGTTAYQVALRLFTQPGDDVVVCKESHAMWHETGAAATNAGIQFTEIGSVGSFTAAEFLAALKPRGHVLYPPTTLVEVEDTHNRAGGVVFPPDEAAGIAAAAREHHVASYLRRRAALQRGDRGRTLSTGRGGAVRSRVDLDVEGARGARWVGAGGEPRRHPGCGSLPTHVRRGDTPGGYLRGRRPVRTRSQRGAPGRGSRQRAADRRRAGREPVGGARPTSVRANILVFHVTADAPDAATVVARAKDRGVLVFAFGPRTVRAVTHPDVSAEDCVWAASLLLEAVDAS